MKESGADGRRRVSISCQPACRRCDQFGASDKQESICIRLDVIKCREGYSHYDPWHFP